MSTYRITLIVNQRKLKRKKYNSVEHFMKDVELIFTNAKQYNEDDSIIYRDAVELAVGSFRSTMNIL
jgi:chromatin structure-remodeling complex subunit RSC1/2